MCPIFDLEDFKIELVDFRFSDRNELDFVFLRQLMFWILFSAAGNSFCKQNWTRKNEGILMAGEVFGLLWIRVSYF